MFLANILHWWYGNGWLGCIQKIKNRLGSMVDFFSINLLISTLFAPYRQISAGAVAGSLNVQVRAFFDNLLSRIIGAIVRSCLIIFGLIVITLQTMLGVIVVISWLVIPFLPVIGLIMMIIGWVPEWNL